MAAAKRRPKTEPNEEPELDARAKKSLRAQAAFIEQLAKMPIVSAAVKATGTGRSTYYAWRKDKGFRDLADAALAEGRRIVNDVAFSKLLEHISNGHLTALIFWLKNNHLWFAERIRHEYTHEHHIVDDDVMTPDQREQIIKALIRSGRVHTEEAEKLLREKFKLSLGVDKEGGADLNNKSTWLR